MPRVYLATPITSVSEEDRRLIVRWCEWYIENELADKNVFCSAIEYDRGAAKGPAQTEADLIAVRDRSWRKLDASDELHVLHPDRSTNAAVEFGYAMGKDLERVVVIAFEEWLPGEIKSYKLRLLMHKPEVEFVFHSLVELGLLPSSTSKSSQGFVTNI